MRDLVNRENKMDFNERDLVNQIVKWKLRAHTFGIACASMMGVLVVFINLPIIRG
jgi:hypothetical protein